MQKNLSFGRGSGRLPFQLGQLVTLTLLGFELAPVRDASEQAKKFVTEFNSIAEGDEEAVVSALAKGQKYSDEVYTRAVCVDETGKEVRTIDAGFSTKPTPFICVEGAEYTNPQGNKVKGLTLRKATVKEIEAAKVA